MLHRSALLMTPWLMSPWLIVATLIAASLIGGSIIGQAETSADEPQASADDLEHFELEHFEKKIRPLLNEHCFACHSARAKTVHAGLRLDTQGDLLQGGDSGQVLVPGQPGESLFVETIRYDGDIQMPPTGKLSKSEIALLTGWIKQGAAFPPTIKRGDRQDEKIDFQKGRKFWSFQPLHRQSLPEISQARWPRTRIDFFTLAAMDREGLVPSARADRGSLIRRLSFDLTGLPPTPEQVDDFVNDDSPGAYERLVDRLLNSPQYGEKWARWWLDMARYTDRTATWLYQTGQSHLYRDWVMKAFDEDMPYDEFIRRQLATDLLQETGPEDLPALGFISLSPTYWKELKLPCEIINVIVADEWEERVDAVSRTFLGLTVACARCHDHKFDPISSEDYYALAGIFASCRQIERPVISDEQYEPVRLAKEQVAKLEAEMAKLKKAKPPAQDKIAELSTNISLIKTTTPLYDSPMANALSEESMFVVRAGKTAQDGTRLEYRPGPRDLPAFVRGNPNRPGPVVKRRFLSVLSDDLQPYQHGSGRLELAASITSDAAPLSARVIVNRIWLAHFGRGIVDTPSNFGQQGSRPTHPRLLDDLAARFVRDGWSLKRLHREIVLSATWQQSSATDESRRHDDPSNRWLSRMNRRRLPFEAWRDSMLVSSGVLDRSTGGRSIELDAAGNRRRTIYGTVHRRNMSTTLMVHDFPDPTQHSPQRNSTVTALQGLYALNGPLLAEQSRALVERLQRERPGGDLQRIKRAYELLYSRLPNQRERQLGLAYLGGAKDELKWPTWHQYAQVLLISNELMFID